MNHEVILRFCLWDFDDISSEDITKTLGIKPEIIYKKGQQKNPNSISLAKNNGWIMGSSLDKYTSFEEQMNALLDIIEAKIDKFKPLCNKYYSEFSCAIFIRFENGDSYPSVHLDKRYNKIIKELNIEFDLDLYCFHNRESQLTI